jgi:hypothetical protein
MRRKIIIELYVSKLVKNIDISFGIISSKKHKINTQKQYNKIA